MALLALHDVRDLPKYLVTYTIRYRNWLLNDMPDALCRICCQHLSCLSRNLPICFSAAIKLLLLLLLRSSVLLLLLFLEVKG